VTYNGNGSTSGSVPTDQNRYAKGATVTILGTGSLAKTENSLTGWTTNQDGSGTGYSAGATFIMGSANVALYAAWTVSKYTVTYDANGGTGQVPTDPIHYTHGTTVTILGTGSLAKTENSLTGWTTNQDGSGTGYSAGATFVMGSVDVTLYAAWIPSALSITNSGTGITINAPSGGYSPPLTGSLSIPSTVTAIGDSAFSGCTGLTNVGIPASVTSIGKNAFYRCTGLTSITIPSGVTSIGDEAFEGCTGLTSVTIPSGVTSIGNATFFGCPKLASVTIPDGVTTIGWQAFEHDWCLTSVTIPPSVTTIASMAFMECPLVTVSIPASVTNIGSKAFYDCKLSSVIVNATSPPTLGTDAFFSMDETGLQIKVPAGTDSASSTLYVDIYKATAVWSGYASKIVSQ